MTPESSAAAGFRDPIDDECADSPVTDPTQRESIGVAWRQFSLTDMMLCGGGGTARGVACGERAQLDSALRDLVSLQLDAEPLAPGRLAPEGRRVVQACRLADPDAHAAVARASRIDRFGQRLPGAIQVVLDPGRRAFLYGRALRGVERAADTFSVPGMTDSSRCVARPGARYTRWLAV